MKILVTGGASGLGEAITKTLAKESDNTIYFTYNNSKINAQKIELAYPNTFAIKCNFSDNEDLESLKSKMTSVEIDILINNAYNGGFLKSYFHKTNPNDFLDDFNKNIYPTIYLSQVAITNFRKKKGGKIITILTSALVNTPPIGSSVYIANKAYLQQLTKVWAVENAKFNITSNTISPSLLATNLTKEIDERIVDQIIESHPLKKLLTVDEVAEAVLFLSNASSQINGIDLLINSASNIK